MVAQNDKWARDRDKSDCPKQIPVSPGFGGRLSSPGDQVVVEFPPGAVAELAIATYCLVTETLPAIRQSVGPLFDLSAGWYSGGASVASFQRPVIITVHY